MHYLVDRAKEAQLVALLKQLEARRGELGVGDVQLSLTSLEDVFLAIARQVGRRGARRGRRGQRGRRGRLGLFLRVIACLGRALSSLWVGAVGGLLERVEAC